MLAIILVMAAIGLTIIGSIVALFETRRALDRRRFKRRAQE
ncbi:hypothetical protein [Bradyrhizobium sp. 149]|nr:hypothetical protein [Bradyrhizobium sp. 149]